MNTDDRERTLARFWKKVNKTDTCWLWLGASTAHGYGQFSKDERTWRAHRAAYELLVGKIPDGLTLDHLCRNKMCVRPSHLEPVTDRVNILRGFSPSALNARKVACPYGHEFNERNTRTTNGVRYCRPCHVRQSKESLLRRREREARNAK